MFLYSPIEAQFKDFSFDCRQLIVELFAGACQMKQENILQMTKIKAFWLCVQLCGLVSKQTIRAGERAKMRRIWRPTIEKVYTGYKRVFPVASTWNQEGEGWLRKVLVTPLNTSDLYVCACVFLPIPNLLTGMKN